MSAVLSADEFLYVVHHLVTSAAETYLLSCRLIDDKKREERAGHVCFMGETSN